MSWLRANHEGITVSASETESGVIAESVSHVWVGAETTKARDELRSVMEQESDTELLIVRFESSLRWIPQVIVDVGDRILIPGGSILYWRAPTTPTATGAGDWHDKALPPLKQLGSDDTEDVVSAIQTTFTDYSNHYTSNPMLRPIDPATAYADWAKRSLALDQRAVLVALDDPRDTIAAIALVDFGDESADILLAGVDPRFRSRGLYSSFLPRVVRTARDRGFPEVVISTQDHNVAVQRLWSRLGFEPTLAVNVVHAMRTPRI